MIRQIPVCYQREDAALMRACEHRTVSADGRITCSKIVQGDRTVSTALCRTCPSHSVNCAHLRFSLERTSASPLIVRCNGRTEVWSDEVAQLLFFHAACAERVVPIHSPSACADCPFHQPLTAEAELASVRSAAARPGKVVPFPAHEPLAATG